MRSFRMLAVAAVAIGAFTLSACAGGTTEPAAGAAEEDGLSVDTVRIGYFPNVTHAPAIIGLADGQFQSSFGDDVTIETATFNSGTEEIEALFAGGIDIGFIGPSPTVTGWQKSNGQALHVIAGAAANGAALVVREGIDTPADLEGMTIATPSLGNTQDVAARHWLKEEGFSTDTEGGGDVQIQPQDNATALTALQIGDIDGAWVPEPWATRMVEEAGAHVLVNEPDLWEGGQFVTTNVIVRTQFLQEHPDAVEAFLAGLLDTIDSIEADPAAAQATVATEIGKISGSTPKADQLAKAWENVVFTADPLPATLREQAQHAIDLGLLEETDLDGLYVLDPLNALLKERGENTVDDE
ncbi:ABC transporter substrate-binding protein [Microbacterium sp. RU33B]|uniref:ABC transporter substrate-binding protein n=1 Tax=Microbacterium sp. RU33B TaxID=1907390 RepID=UPI000963ADA3|nr:ABC transporter substrate-binding protein [Microbacterium sp. RU33B]SIT84366.1 NitT/TauT family transport system substrate-binding protein [Microbacterium sp. RU33B]